jgi:hypothetical protein
MIECDLVTAIKGTAINQSLLLKLWLSKFLDIIQGKELLSMILQKTCSSAQA